MHIIQTGNVFAASSPNDKSQHFLSITFGLGKPADVLFFDFTSQGELEGHKTLIKITMLTLETMLPVAERYYPHEVLYRSDDSPDIEEYTKLVLAIYKSAITFL